MTNKTSIWTILGVVISFIVLLFGNNLVGRFGTEMTFPNIALPQVSSPEISFSPITSILSIIAIGFLAGAFAKFLMPGKDPGGMIITILLGIAGSVVGGFLGGIIGVPSNGLLGQIIVATGGAFVLLLVYRLLFKG